jgi:DegV family protein with EDD domain
MKIVTDCAADIPAAESEALGLTTAPMWIQFPQGEVSSADLSIDDFYDRLEAMRPALPTTAQPSSGDFAAIYRRLAVLDDQVLSIHISGGLSGTVNAAHSGREQAGLQGQVTVWDSLTLSGGERFQVLAAALAAKAGWVVEAITQRLAEIRLRSEVLYTLDTLEYLRRGGRIGRVQALAGALLNIKPVIGVDHKDGKYNNLGRSRTIGQALQVIGDQLYAVYGDMPLWITVLHGRFGQQAGALAQILGARLNAAKMETLRISPVLGVHTGPGIVGAAAAPMELFEDLM